MTNSDWGPEQVGKSQAPSPPDGASERNSDYLAARSAAFRLLGYRGRSEAEVRRRLTPRYHSQVIDRVITALTEQGYLDDAAFARQWRSSRERRRPRGQRLLRQELLGKGVPEETIREALENFDGPGNAYRAGLSLAMRLARGEFSQFRRRLWSLLQRRGFDGGVITETVRTLWQELSDPLNGSVDAETDEEQTENTQ